MNRLRFMAAFLGIPIALKAQKCSADHPDNCVAGGIPPQWQFGTALNNQCPVCGEMVEPQKLYMSEHIVRCDPPPTGVDSSYIVCLEPDPPPPIEKRGFQMTSCRRCRVVFMQQLEPPKP